MREKKFLKQARGRVELHSPFLPAGQQSQFSRWRCVPPKKAEPASLAYNAGRFIWGNIPKVWDWRTGKRGIRKEGVAILGSILLGTL